MQEVLDNLKKPAWVNDYFNLLFDVKSLVQNSQKLSISLIDGFAIGGGLGVGFSSDVIIATNRAKLAMSGASVGLGTFSSCVRNVENFEYLAFLNAYGLLMSPYELQSHIVDYVIDFEKK